MDTDGIHVIKTWKVSVEVMCFQSLDLYKCL
jgi:hypothetical protein